MNVLTNILVMVVKLILLSSYLKAFGCEIWLLARVLAFTWTKLPYLEALGVFSRNTYTSHFITIFTNQNIWNHYRHDIYKVEILFAKLLDNSKVLKINSISFDWNQFSSFTLTDFNNWNGVSVSPKNWQFCFNLVKITTIWFQYFRYFSQTGHHYKP